MFDIRKVSERSHIGRKQELFAWLFHLLHARAYACGYRQVAGETFRGPAQVAAYVAAGSGSADTLHADCLAGHLELFTAGGIYLDSTLDFYELGQWWKAQHPLARWGGDFSRPDGCHFSVADRGRA
jgi:hypothetical protein